jgi:hypothetical protein
MRSPLKSWQLSSPSGVFRTVGHGGVREGLASIQLLFGYCGTGQVGPAQVGLLQGSPGEVSIPQVSPVELGVVQVGIHQVGPLAIVRQGEVGDSCYLLREGRAEVLAHEGESEERNLATLGPGSLFGEAALLTDAPRNATVRALDPCELLALHRSDLLEAVGEDRQIGERMLELLRLRDRPRQAPGIQAHHRDTATGETITTLKDPERGTYYRLSPGGWFVWQRLDGEHNLRDLTLEYFTEFQAFTPQAVAETVGGLAEAGFAEGVKPASGVLENAIQPTRVQRTTALARRILE